jgi:hypothetical protein
LISGENQIDHKNSPKKSLGLPITPRSRMDCRGHEEWAMWIAGGQDDLRPEEKDRH